MKDHASRITHRLKKALAATLFLAGLFGSMAPLSVAAQTTPLCCLCAKAGQNVCVNVVLSAGESVGDNCTGLTGTQTYRNMVGDRTSLFEGFRCSAVLDAQGCTAVGTNTSSRCPAGTPVNLEALPARYTATTTGASASGTVGETPREQPFQPVVPVLGVQIPGLTFTPASREGTNVTIPYLAEYINAGYRYMVGVIMIIAIIMVVWGGFRFLLGSAHIGNITKAKETIRDAIVGMLLVIGAYVILQTVNPATTELRSMELSSVAGQVYDLDLQEQGTWGDESADYSAASDSGSDPTQIRNVTPGTWRAQMMEVCRQNAGSLTVDQRRQELRRIVDVWKRVGVDRGGAIYIRGGNPSCSSSHPQASWLQSKLRTQAVFAAAVPAECRAATASVSSCLSPWRQAYDRLLREPARAAGLFCGDCFTTVMQIYRCLGGSTFHARVREKRITARDCGSSASGYVFKLKRGATAQDQANGILPWNDASDLQRAFSRLRFGDVIAWTKSSGGHVMLYTGGVNLGYEIMEMGGGWGGTHGGATALQNSGSSWRGGAANGLGVHRTIMGYLGGRATRDAICLYAWRPIEP